MTEAMSRREIEDVLSSIKRLVSQDAKGRVVPAASAEKLLLTPSLRVKEPSSGAATASVPTPDAPGKPNEPLNFAQSLPDLAKVQDAHQSDGSSLPGHDGSLIRRIAQAGLSRDAVSLADKDETQAVSASPIVPDTAPQAADGSRDILEPQASDADIEETLARLEAVLSGQNPRQQTADTNAVPADPTLSDSSGHAAAEQIIDEGMLYQLVAHIVRQELQGELGEKITRNIRKLVRSEVARELQLRRP